MDADRVVFPDDTNTVPPSSVTTSSPAGQSSVVTVAIVIVVVVVVLCFVALALYLYRRKKGKEEGEKEEVDGKVSVKTLGSHYEVESLLSINTADNKSGVTLDAVNGHKNTPVYHLNVTTYIDSDVSGSQDMQQDGLEVREKGEVNMKDNDTHHENVKLAASTYIDASSHASSKTINHSQSRRSSKITMDEIVSRAEGYLADPNRAPAPLAQEEDSDSRPVSSLIKDVPQVQMRSDRAAGSTSSRTLPSSASPLPPTSLFPQSISVCVQPPSPALERPASECLEKAPTLPMKKKMEGSTSEQNVNTRLGVSPGRGDSKPNNVNMTKSDSNLISSVPVVPALPPKSKPLLPPKQAINKSREDVEKITKDLMRASSNMIPIRKHNPDSKVKESPMLKVDEDYDFPAENPEVREDEDYDDPSHSFNRTWEYQDYDDPAHSYN